MRADSHALCLPQTSLGTLSRSNLCGHFISKAEKENLVNPTRSFLTGAGVASKTALAQKRRSFRSQRAFSLWRPFSCPAPNSAHSGRFWRHSAAVLSWLLSAISWLRLCFVKSSFFCYSILSALLEFYLKPEIKTACVS